MRRIDQDFDTLVSSLMPVEASWFDKHAEHVIEALKALPQKTIYTSKDISRLLEDDFKVGTTAIRLILGLSADEFKHALREALGGDGIGVKRYTADPIYYTDALASLGLTDQLTALVNAPVTWQDIMFERLRVGRGSAIKGQNRGRSMEDFVESIVRQVFHDDQIELRCRFTGARGASTEKTDVAIPSAQNPAILIEAKAYGATGSKQTDVLGDVARIVEEKRHDTSFLLVTDGITWKQRLNDLRKLVELQNEGRIQRIYTKSMAPELLEDLEALKLEAGL